MDTAMDAHMQGHSAWVELIQHPSMLFYRSLFVFFVARRWCRRERLAQAL